MSYIVFARKYRPQNFDEITGQSHITTTLKNAITNDRVAHAYIFAGPRGVGKTTTARILAKALNCEKGPTVKPCNKCASCQEITSGSSLDIFEIDGASNRGIDEIRSLRENAKFTPVKGRFKVYIIDEVHMLSNEAFNALLKTLEEPPPHVKFIFATTHAHKVPPTILSRCQRFDFRRIPTKEILESLRRITKEEKLSVSEEALGLIAKYGDGSMRDAQVILDQIASFAEGKVNAEDVTEILGAVNDEVLFGISAAITAKDPKAALMITSELVDGGKDVMQVVLGLIEHFRNIAIAKVGKDVDTLIDAGSDKIARYCEEAGRFTVEQILYIIYTLSNTIDFIRKTNMARIPFEAALVKLTQNSGIVPLDDIMKRVEALESKVSQSAKIAPASCAPGVAAPAERDIAGKPQPEKPEGSAGQERPETVSKVASSRQRLSLEDILSSWTKVIGYIRAKKISIASYLQEGNPTSLEGDIITIGFAKEFQFHKEVLESIDNKKLIETAIKEMLGVELRASLVVTGPAVTKRVNGSGYIADPDDVESEGGIEVDDSDPIVKKALEMFGGKIAEGSRGHAR